MCDFVLLPLRARDPCTVCTVIWHCRIISRLRYDVIVHEITKQEFILRRYCCQLMSGLKAVHLCQISNHIPYAISTCALGSVIVATW